MLLQLSVQVSCLVCRLLLGMQSYYNYLHQDMHYSHLSLLGGLLAIPLTLGKSMLMSKFVLTVIDPFVTAIQASDRSVSLQHVRSVSLRTFLQA